MPANQVIIIAVTDGYTSFLSVAVSISLPVRLLCAQNDEQRWKTGGFEILSPQCEPSRLSDKDYLT